MKRFIVMVVILVASVFICTILATKLNTQQRDLLPDREGLSKSPIAGFHKFASDVQWMRLVNYLGSLNTIDERNVKEVSAKLESLLALDNSNEVIYRDGVLAMSIADPQKTIEFLNKACKNEYLRNNWQIPFYAGYVMMHATKPPKYNEAAGFFLMALKRAGSDQGASYVASSYLRAKARAEAKGGDERYAMLKVLYEEWKNSKGGTSDQIHLSGENGSLITNINARLIKAIRDIKVKSPDYTPSAEATVFADKLIREIFEKEHICHQCTAKYAPGEKFCSSCGAQLKVYGLCVTCKQPLSEGAKYCAHCGTRVE